MFTRRIGIPLFLVLGFSWLCHAQEMAEGRLMRFPDVGRDRIVFSYAGDLWLVPRTGGDARRITTNPGLELFPKFSPDGKWIAFTGQYDGNFNVYVIPSGGGEPKQLTFLPDIGEVPERMGPNNEVITWSPDSKRIVFLSRRDTFNTWFGRLFSVSVDGGLPVRLPIDKGGLASFSPDGNSIAYNRIFRNFRTWKRYTGGMAQDIAIYDFKTNQYEQITHYPGTDTFPMWRGDTIYFTSDRDPARRLNLYAYDLKTKKVGQLTHFTDWDLNWPSLGPDAIVFENGGYLYEFDLAARKEHRVTVRLPGDFDSARPHWEKTARWITDFGLSPEGKRAVFTARGDVYTVPGKEGNIRNLTQTPGIREECATWSPDGRWVAYLSDRTGEEELYIVPQSGMGQESRITSDGTMFRLAPVWSPDSRKLLFADKSLRLFYVDIDAKQPVLIDQGKYADLTDYAWSPDSQWAAYSKAADNQYGVIYLYSLGERKITPLTTSFTNSWKPSFDPEGNYLYFLSNRTYNEVLGVYDVEFSNPKATRIFAVTLKADLPSPFAPRSDEEAARQAAVVQKEATPAPFRIDLAGISDRIVAIPTPAAVIPDLVAAKDFVCYATVPVSGLSGPLAGEEPAIHVFDMKERKDHVLVEGADGFALSFDGKKVLYKASGPGGGEEEGGEAVEGHYGIVDAAPLAAGPHKNTDGRLDLSGMQAQLDPPAEWKQIFYEVYRQERDYFFEPSMNGVDWTKVRDQYAQLLPYVKDRYDLTYVLGEMIGELCNSHTYVGGGDYPDLHPVNVGLLGADFEADAQSGLYRFKKIYPGENWDPALRSPLTEPGVTVKEGDYLIAVDGRQLRAGQNPYELFVNKAGQEVTLTVNSSPGDQGAKQVRLRTVGNEFRLRELDWIDTNRRKVDEASAGRIGYVYLPDMSAPGLNEFVKQYFPQIRKEGLVFDVRYNGGGFVDQIIFARLRRILAGMDAARNFESGTIPDQVFNGYMACVTNAYAASDGDFFTHYFKYYKLGPVIGMRTWGGVRGIRGYMPLIDGGYITRPEFSLYGLDSKWLIENVGVEPDIAVDNTPDQVMAGRDPQLDRAVELLMKEIKEGPRKLPPRPPDLPAYPKPPWN